MQLLDEQNTWPWGNSAQNQEIQYNLLRVTEQRHLNFPIEQLWHFVVSLSLFLIVEAEVVFS